MAEYAIFAERPAIGRKPRGRDERADIDDRSRKPGAEQAELRQAERAEQQEIDQQRIGRDRGQRDPQDRLGAVDRAHEAADRHEPQRRQDGPDQPGEIFLREMRRHGRLAQHQQDLLGPEPQRHQRQRDQQRGPQADAQRPPDQMRIACAKGLRGQRRDC